MSIGELIRSATSDAGRPLEAHLCLTMEECLRTSLRDVRLHFSPASQTANTALRSLAFAVDGHVCFRARFDPFSRFQTYVLIHEVAHIAQKRRGAESMPAAIPSAGELELEANAISFAMMDGTPAARITPDPSPAPRCYGPAGHYYTALYAALAVGFSLETAKKIAFYTQLPDLVSELDATFAGLDYGSQVLRQQGDLNAMARGAGNLPVSATMRAMKDAEEAAQRMDYDWQIQTGLHALTGQPSKDETERRKDNFRKCKTPEKLPDFGLAIHALGDSYAHRDFHDETIMYGPPFGHLAEAVNHAIRLDQSWDPHDPDRMELRPWLYDRYCQDLYTTMAPMCNRKAVLQADEFTKSAYDATRDKADEKLQKIILKSKIRDLLSDTIGQQKAEAALANFYDPAEDAIPWKTFVTLNMSQCSTMGVGPLSPDILTDCIRCAREWTGSAVRFTTSVHGSWTDLSRNLFPSWDDVTESAEKILGPLMTPPNPNGIGGL